MLCVNSLAGQQNSVKHKMGDSKAALLKRFDELKRSSGSAGKADTYFASFIMYRQTNLRISLPYTDRQKTETLLSHNTTDTLLHRLQPFWIQLLTSLPYSLLFWTVDPQGPIFID